MWASHGDDVGAVPPGFAVAATSNTAPIVAMEAPERQLYALLFHPEVVHTEHGVEILRNFAYGECGCTGDWTISSFIEESTERIRQQVVTGVVCGLSGGVDSTVAAMLIHRAIGDRLTYLRRQRIAPSRRSEPDSEAVSRQAASAARFRRCDRSVSHRLVGVTDPEQKRKVIGGTFIDVFETRANELGGSDSLVRARSIRCHRVRIRARSRRRHQEPSQRRRTARAHALQARGTASRSVQGRSPARVRTWDSSASLWCGNRFPDRALRFVCSVRSPSRGSTCCVPRIVLSRTRSAARDGYERLWQSFAVLLPVQSVGVMGDTRTAEYTIAIRLLKAWMA